MKLLHIDMQRREGWRPPGCPWVRGRSVGFTLVEMLVVVAIIVVLLAITIPVLSFARRAATRMAGQSQISALDSSIRNYFADQNAYPPLVASYTIWNCCDDTCPDAHSQSAVWGGLSSCSEFLVLTLLGGITTPRTGSSRSPSIPNYFANPTFRWTYQSTNCYDPAAVGKGPLSGPGATIPPLRQLECYYKYKADELNDFDGNGLYEFKDKCSPGMPVLYYYRGYDSRQNGPKYYNGSNRTYYKVLPDGSPYDPRTTPDSATLVDDPQRSQKHFLIGQYNVASGWNLSMYFLTWPGSGSGLWGSNADLRGGDLPNNGDYVLFSAGPDGYFGPPPSTLVKSNGISLSSSNVSDQPTIRQMIVDCDDVTSWSRK